MKLPVFDGVQEALEKYNLQRKRKLERERKQHQLKRRIELKKRRVVEGFKRSEWSRTHGRDAYGGSIGDDEHESQHSKAEGARLS